MKIAVLLSGGVDSSVAVHLLCEQGFKPDLFYIKIGMEGAESLSCSSEEDIELAEAIARRYGLGLEVVDLHAQYWERVVSYTLDKVRQGLTPNPDVMCNKLIKFGCFEEQVGHRYDKTATGHYATTREIDGKVWLGTAKDALKDQTDFLAQIDYLQVSKLLFPIGHLLKAEVRDAALKNNIPSALRKDSQGICFLGKIDFAGFIKRYFGEREGKIVELETGRVVGKHRGYWFYTIGQRKGLGLGGGPWFVIRKDVDENTVYVSNGYDTEKQYGRDFSIAGFHFITENPWPDASTGVDVTIKVRHTPEFTPAVLRCSDGLYRIESREKIQGICPGQFGVVYDRDAQICIGGGEMRLP
ncbi:MAG: tRNA 2-thiouridine(34) synthase MnmA [Mediterranea sp.]|jgi:tRNA-specific 2-thiouridylase|nr:tRNA 2-thiouridine(34) synthase MnmA [Mediterranea sp.]